MAARKNKPEIAKNANSRKKIITKSMKVKVKKVVKKPVKNINNKASVNTEEKANKTKPSEDVPPKRSKGRKQPSNVGKGDSNNLGKGRKPDKIPRVRTAKPVVQATSASDSKKAVQTPGRRATKKAVQTPVRRASKKAVQTPLASDTEKKTQTLLAIDTKKEPQTRAVKSRKKPTQSLPVKEDNQTTLTTPSETINAIKQTTPTAAVKINKKSTATAPVKAGKDTTVGQPVKANKRVKIPPVKVGKQVTQNPRLKAGKQATQTTRVRRNKRGNKNDQIQETTAESMDTIEHSMPEVPLHLEATVEEEPSTNGEEIIEGQQAANSASENNIENPLAVAAIEQDELFPLDIDSAGLSAVKVSVKKPRKSNKNGTAVKAKKPVSIKIMPGKIPGSRGRGRGSAVSSVRGRGADVPVGRGRGSRGRASNRGTAVPSVRGQRGVNIRGTRGRGRGASNARGRGASTARGRGASNTRGVVKLGGHTQRGRGGRRGTNSVQFQEAAVENDLVQMSVPSLNGSQLNVEPVVDDNNQSESHDPFSEQSIREDQLKLATIVNDKLVQKAEKIIKGNQSAIYTSDNQVVSLVPADQAIGGNLLNTPEDKLAISVVEEDESELLKSSKNWALVKSTIMNNTNQLESMRSLYKWNKCLYKENMEMSSIVQLSYDDQRKLRSENAKLRSNLATSEETIQKLEQMNKSLWQELDKKTLESEVHYNSKNQQFLLKKNFKDLTEKVKSECDEKCKKLERELISVSKENEHLMKKYEKLKDTPQKRFPKNVQFKNNFSTDKIPDPETTSQLNNRALLEAHEHSLKSVNNDGETELVIGNSTAVEEICISDSENDDCVIVCEPKDATNSRSDNSNVFQSEPIPREIEISSSEENHKTALQIPHILADQVGVIDTTDDSDDEIFKRSETSISVEGNLSTEDEANQKEPSWRSNLALCIMPSSETVESKEIKFDTLVKQNVLTEEHVQPKPEIISNENISNKTQNASIMWTSDNKTKITISELQNNPVARINYDIATTSTSVPKVNQIPENVQLKKVPVKWSIVTEILPPPKTLKTNASSPIPDCRQSVRSRIAANPTEIVAVNQAAPCQKLKIEQQILEKANKRNQLSAVQSFKPVVGQRLKTLSSSSSSEADDEEMSSPSPPDVKSVLSDIKIAPDMKLDVRKNAPDPEAGMYVHPTKQRVSRVQNVSPAYANNLKLVTARTSEQLKGKSPMCFQNNKQLNSADIKPKLRKTKRHNPPSKRVKTETPSGDVNSSKPTQIQSGNLNEPFVPCNTLPQNDPQAWMMMQNMYFQMMNMQKNMMALTAQGFMGAVPGGMGAVPGGMGALPGGMGALPGGMGAVPGGMGALPGGMGAVPGGMGAVPGGMGALPGGMGAVPGGMGALPGGMGAQFEGVANQARGMGDMQIMPSAENPPGFGNISTPNFPTQIHPMLNLNAGTSAIPPAIKVNVQTSTINVTPAVNSGSTPISNWTTHPVASGKADNLTMDFNRSNVAVSIPSKETNVSENVGSMNVEVPSYNETVSNISKDTVESVCTKNVGSMNVEVPSYNETVSNISKDTVESVCTTVPKLSDDTVHTDNNPLQNRCAESFVPGTGTISKINSSKAVVSNRSTIFVPSSDETSLCSGSMPVLLEETESLDTNTSPEDNVLRGCLDGDLFLSDDSSEEDDLRSIPSSPTPEQSYTLSEPLNKWSNINQGTCSESVMFLNTLVGKEKLELAKYLNGTARCVELDCPNIPPVMGLARATYNFVFSDGQNMESGTSDRDLPLSYPAQKILSVIQVLARTDTYRELPLLAIEFFDTQIISNRCNKLQVGQDNINLVKLGRFYGALSRQFNLVEEIKRVIFNALYWRPVYAFSLTYGILCLHSDIFSGLPYEKFGLTERSMIYALAGPPHFIDAKHIRPVQSLLKQSLNLMIPELTYEQFVDTLLEEMKSLEEDNILKKAAKAVSMLCMQMNLKLFEQFIITRITRWVADWQHSNITDAVLAGFINVIGTVGYDSPKQGDINGLKTIVSKLKSINVDIMSPILKEAILSSYSKIEKICMEERGAARNNTGRIKKKKKNKRKKPFMDKRQRNMVKAAAELFSQNKT